MCWFLPYPSNRYFLLKPLVTILIVAHIVFSLYIQDHCLKVAKEIWDHIVRIETRILFLESRWNLVKTLKTKIHSNWNGWGTAPIRQSSATFDLLLGFTFDSRRFNHQSYWIFLVVWRCNDFKTNVASCWSKDGKRLVVPLSCLHKYTVQNTVQVRFNLYCGSQYHPPTHMRNHYFLNRHKEQREWNPADTKSSGFGIPQTQRAARMEPSRH